MRARATWLWLGALTACTGASPSASEGLGARPGGVETTHAGSQKCEPGRRLGFVFWGHARGPAAEAVVTRHLAEGAPKAVLWKRVDENFTVIVPDEETGKEVVEVARDLKLKIQREDYVAVDASCGLSWMDHGVDVAALASKPREAPDAGVDDGGAAVDAGAPIDAGAAAKSKPEPTPEAKACDAAIVAPYGEYAKAVGHQTSVASTKMLLRVFAKACDASLPDLAKAAGKASRVGRAARSRILGEASTSFCPVHDDAKSAELVAKECPPIEGDATLAVWKLLDPGTYAFTQELKKLGIASVLVDELILQASLHPELDK